MSKIRRAKKQRGSALITAFGALTLVALAAASYIDRATQVIRDSNLKYRSTQTTHLCEAGVQAVLRDLWRPFKVEQNFEAMEDSCAGATSEIPRVNLLGELPGVGKYASGVIDFYSPGGDVYSRIVKVRSVGWVDHNDNDVVDEGEPNKVIDVVARFDLKRSEVFDYMYFVNNYGWFENFSADSLVINGDIRANGDLDFINGSPTVNGSVGAANNDKLLPGRPGNINIAPIKWSDGTYKTKSSGGTEWFRDRWRQPYDPAVHGAIGSDEFNKWKDLVFNSVAGSVSNGDVFSMYGSRLMDSSGVRGWVRENSGAPTYNQIDRDPTEEIIMPDLSDLGYYQNLSQTYVDDKPTFNDGTANTNYGQGAWLEVWDAGQNKYVRISTNGIVNGNVVAVGTLDKPIKIHGPVTISQDLVIKGYVQGQGTIYTGRNVHIVGSLRYKSGPDFRGTNMQQIENQNEKRDFLGLAARRSILFGNSTTWNENSTVMRYMRPPFTKPRYDENGNLIPAYDGWAIDPYFPTKRYAQSLVDNSTVNGLSEAVNQVDAILYTNFLGGGDVGKSGGGCWFNGTIISKDEAIVVWSAPARMNYDNRIRERNIERKPLIELNLPRSPSMLRSTWQERSFCMN